MKLEFDVDSLPSPSADSHFETELTFGEVKDMLRASIKLAKDGNRSEAKHLLLRVTEAEADNETAWLWLASISEYPEELLVFLQKVLTLNPQNERALDWSKATKSLLSKNFVQRGIKASNNNQLEFARQCFNQAIAHEAENETAWLGLASTADSTEEKIGYFQKVLALNPANEEALNSIKAFQTQNIQSLLRQANSAAISGEQETARQLLEEIMAQTSDYEEAWILKAYLAADFHEKISCYENALTINPQNEAAQAGLTSLQALIQRNAENKLEISKRIAEFTTGNPVNAQDADDSNYSVADTNELPPIHHQFLETAANAPAEPSYTDEYSSNQPPDEVELELADKENVETSPVEEISRFEETSQKPDYEILEGRNPFSERLQSLDAENSASYHAQENSSLTDESQPDENQFQAPESHSYQADSRLESEVQETSFAEDSTPYSDEMQPEVVNFEETYEEENPDEFVEKTIKPAAFFEESADEEVFEDTHADFQPESVKIKVESHSFDAQQSENSEDESYLIDDTQVPNKAEEYFQPTVQTEQSSQPAYSSANPEFSNNSEQNPSAESGEQFTESDYSAENANLDLTGQSANSTDSTPEFSDFAAESKVTGELPKQEYFSEASENSYTPEIEEMQFQNNQTESQETASEDFQNANSEQVFENDAAPENQNFDSSEFDTAKAEESPAAQENFAASHPTEYSECSLCRVENESQAITCHNCRAMLSLSDLESLLAYQSADNQLMLQAIERMETEKSLRVFSADECCRLGMAHLNAKNFRQGLAYLNEALNLNPNDVVLGSKVNFLTIRLNEIEEKENKSPESSVVGRTILVVDDSPTVRKLISGKLEKCGHSVVSAVDGMDALAKINEITPDLVLLDITMPRMDGYQVCKMIRNNEVTKNIPVVMISGKDGFFDKVRGRMSGSTGYITKPFGPETLMKTLEIFLN